MGKISYSPNDELKCEKMSFLSILCSQDKFKNCSSLRQNGNLVLNFLKDDSLENCNSFLKQMKNKSRRMRRNRKGKKIRNIRRLKKRKILRN